MTTAQTILYLLAAIGACNLVGFLSIGAWILFVWLLDRPNPQPKLPRHPHSPFVGVEAPLRLRRG